MNQWTPGEPEEVRVFLDRCAQHGLGALFEVAILTGLRRGEITGLHWDDVGPGARKIAVRRNRVTANGRVLEQTTTKTKAGLRAVALSDFAVATLLAWQLRQAEEAEAAGEAWRTGGHVFTMEDGRGSTRRTSHGCFRGSAKGLARSCRTSPSTG